MESLVSGDDRIHHPHDVRLCEISQETARCTTGPSEWRIGSAEVQMENGAVQGGTIDQPPTPAVFNTGQVIFGWVRAFLETGKEKYLHSRPDGRATTWSGDRTPTARGGRTCLISLHGKWKPTPTTPEPPGPCSVSSLGSEREKYMETATRNVEYSLHSATGKRLVQEQLSFGSRPRPCSIRSPTASAEFWKRESTRETGSTSRLRGPRRRHCWQGRGSTAACPVVSIRGWKPAANWSCLTGDAQMSIIWGRLYQETRDQKFLEGMKSANDYLKKVQLTHTGNPNLFGGIAGSDPVHGLYGRFEVLSWAVKFFMDALMLEMSIEERRVDG